MPDVKDAKLWNERITLFKDFAHSVGAEFEFKILENGKECVVVKQFYKKGDKNVER